MTRLVSVAELTTYVRVLLEGDELLSDVAVDGEVTQTFTSRAGHIYFTLSDGAVNLKCVMFRGQVARARAKIETGVTVSAFGRVSVYDRDATYQLYVDAVFDSGIGLQAMELERLRQRLVDDGLFDLGRKRQLPVYPKVIGVVTSLQGAVWHDIQTAVQRRYPLAELLLSPAQVQGSHAEASLVVALRRLIDTGRPDVIIVARGGGSVDDLSAFNGEALARAVFGSPIPVVSAIGHETDWSILDEVADVRAPTPTAAAELVTPNVLDLGRSVLQHRIDIEAAIITTVFGAREDCAALMERVEAAHPFTRAQESLRSHRGRLALFRRSLDERLRTDRVRADASRRLVVARRRELVERRRCEIVVPLTARLTASGSVAHLGREAQLASLRSGLIRLGPASVLGRGYALVVGPGGEAVTSVAKVGVGDGVSIHVRDGEIRTTATEIIWRSNDGDGYRYAAD